MQLLLQRVKNASVDVAQERVATIAQGLLVFVGIEKYDTASLCERAAERMLAYRVFADDDGRMNRSVRDVAGSVLLVSQFTLAADTCKGLRPSFSSAMPPSEAQVLFDYFVGCVSNSGLDVQSGCFGADMQVALVNDGPVTFRLSF
ncbi:MAG: D-aminoacyl-tRNA deacylase [Halieaceae bacterium]|nr:D-aminoacyl-tRNA deacylase [Halieaceae bacterium]